MSKEEAMKKYEFTVFRIKKSSRQVLMEGHYKTSAVTEERLKYLIKQEMKKFSLSRKFDVAYLRKDA